MNTNRTPLLGYVCALGATLIWSGNFIVARSLYESVPPATLAFLRWSTAFLALLPIAGPAAWRERAAIRAGLRTLVPTAVLGVTVFNTLLYLAARSTSALNLALIATTSPMFIILFARIFLGEAVTPRRLAGLAAAVVGVVTLVTRGEFSRLASMSFAAGDLLMLLASAIFAAYSILVRRKPRELGQRAYLAATFGIGLACLMPWTAVEVAAHGLPPASPGLLWGVLYVGLGASLTSYVLWNRAVVDIGPARAGLVYYTLPLFSGLEAVLLLGEPMGLMHLVSGTCILGGILVSTRN